jgi:dienelactone hydrolase
MNESCCQFGPEGRLAGIITEPGERTPPRLGLVLVSAGLLPKSGPYGLYTQLARRLARDGVVSLRFDLGGIGDSVQESGTRPLKARTELEIRAALDHLSERYALRGVVLGGLCSGAEDSFRGAASDPRVTGVVLIDPFAYRTSGWAWRHLVHRIARRTLRALGLFEPVAPADTEGKRPRLVRYKYMERPEATHILRALLARNAHVHFVYTAGVREFFNHEGQLRASFDAVDFKGLVTLDYFPDLDHTQLLEADRHALIEAIARRLRAATDAPRP